jgi:hypothetical protein
MSVELLYEIGVLPAALVVLAGMLILYASPEDTARQRFVLFLLAVDVLLCAAIYIAARLTPEQDNRLVAQVSAFLTPTLVGVLALILTRLKSVRGTHPGAKIMLLVFGLALVVLLVLALSSGGGYVSGPLIAASALVLALTWALMRSSWALVAVVIALILGGLALLNQDALLNTWVLWPDWLRMPLQILMFVSPAATVPLAAVLIVTGLRSIPQSRMAAAGMRALRPWLPVILRLGLVLLLLGYYAYTIVWLSIWDHTSDGIGGVWLSMQAQLIAIGAGMLMALSTAGKRRVAGLLFAVLVPLLMAQANQWGWDVSYHVLTEGRAARIRSAVESFQAREGRYPQALGELMPRDLWLIERPVILRGEDWCYEGGRDFYQLAAIYREFFSSPLSIHVYASAGQSPAVGWECDARLSALQARYAVVTEEIHSAPTPAPLPTSVVAVTRTPVQPVAEARNLNLGTLSPDGKYLLFGLPETVEGQRRMALHFLDTTTGQRCTANRSYPLLPEVQEPGLRRHFAWLPNGRLLLVAQPGEILTLQPCGAAVEDLAGRYTERFIQVAASARDGSQLLLRADTAYWVIDGATLQAHHIEVSPTPYELHWDNYAFSPSAERLAIARLNGRDKTDGSTLYIVQARNGNVLYSLPVVDASDQSAPMVEWLTNDELLLHGQGTLRIFDFKSGPPAEKNALRDLFNLDIAYPDDISTVASFPANDGKGYHLAVRVNHPRDKALYLYHSETGETQVLHPEVHALLILPDGQRADMHLLEQGPTYRDEYELIWVDAPGKPVSTMVVQGHAPRNYPMLNVIYLPARSQLAFGSSQGVSLNAIPGGEPLAFWQLGNGIGTYMLAPQGGKALIAVVEEMGLYYLPLPSH